MKQNLTVICALLTACTVAHAASSPTRAELDRAHAAVRLILKDPDSAKFSREFREPGFVCGAVNSKNGFGGYMGDTLYSFEIASGRVLVLDDAASLDGRIAANEKIKRNCHI